MECYVLCVNSCWTPMLTHSFMYLDLDVDTQGHRVVGIVVGRRSVVRPSAAYLKQMLEAPPDPDHPDRASLEIALDTSRTPPPPISRTPINLSSALEHRTALIDPHEMIFGYKSNRFFVLILTIILNAQGSPLPTTLFLFSTPLTPHSHTPFCPPPPGWAGLGQVKPNRSTAQRGYLQGVGKQIAPDSPEGANVFPKKGRATTNQRKGPLRGWGKFRQTDSMANGRVGGGLIPVSRVRKKQSQKFFVRSPPLPINVYSTGGSAIYLSQPAFQSKASK